MDTWRQNIPGKGHSACKGSEVGAGLLCSWLARSRVGKVMAAGSMGEDCRAEHSGFIRAKTDDSRNS